MKRILFLGSSVTYGSAAGGVSFADIVCEKNGYEMVKEAVSGTTLVDDDDSSYVSRLKRLNTDRADLFICQLSTNDAACQKPLGTVSAGRDKDGFDVKTVAGAIEYIISYVSEKWGCPVAFYTGTRFDSAPYAEMVELLKEISKKWGTELINLWDETSFNAVSPEDYGRYMADPVHPTLTGYRDWWAPYIDRAITDIFLKNREYIHTVQYYETDKMGITHHSNYIRWMEEARDYAKLEEAGIVSPVLGISCDYRKSTTFSDKISIRVTVKEFKGVKLFLEYDMKNEKGETVCIGTSSHAFLNAEGRPVRLKTEHPGLYELLMRLAVNE